MIGRAVLQAIGFQSSKVALQHRFNSLGLSMDRMNAIGVIKLAIALAACSAKAPDHCSKHTGDGICVDNDSVANAT